LSLAVSFAFTKSFAFAVWLARKRRRIALTQSIAFSQSLPLA